MQKITFKDKKIALQNGMTFYNIPSKYYVKGDEIKGKTFAIASKTENGGVLVHTNFMSYEAFNAYLFGYFAGLNNKFKP